jgi:DNA-binding transcriptional ArsR family regulator
MVDDETSPNGDTIAPEEAFGLLGNATRVEILRVLGEVDEALSFSDLYDRVDVDDSGQFNYHLDKLVGHFVRKAESGYVLDRPGRRVVEAVLSGAVTGDPEMARTLVDLSCRRCGAPVEIEWRAGSVELYCTECDGAWGQTRGGGPGGGDADSGYLGRLLLPPAGLRDRDPEAVVRTTWTWTMLEVFACVKGVCPRCSATIDRSVSVCAAHEDGDGICSVCEHDYAVTVGFHCTNCIFGTGGSGVLAVLGHPAMLSFLVEQGFDPIQPYDTGVVEAIHQGYEEEILSYEPLSARFTFEADGETLAVRVDEHLDVVETTRGV